MKINVVFNKYIENYMNVLANIESYLSQKGVIYKSFELEDMQNFGDLTLVFGGDGTILRASRFYSKWQVPVIGLNKGRLGFLSQAEDYKVVIDAIINKTFYTEQRMMLSSGKYLALNDFVIKGCDLSRTSKFYLEINNKKLCDYIADGLIISTPTGTTAYGLSAGGPILYPTMDAITIVPICPHSLNARPIVIPSDEEITIKTGDKPLSLYIDGYRTENCINEITITSSKNKAILAFLDSMDFYSVLRNKLDWGISKTN